LLRSIEDYQALRLFFCAGTNDISRTASGWQPRTTAW
jgi:hypothetical protein